MKLPELPEQSTEDTDAEVALDARFMRIVNAGLAVVSATASVDYLTTRRPLEGLTYAMAAVACGYLAVDKNS